MQGNRPGNRPKTTTQLLQLCTVHCRNNAAVTLCKNNHNMQDDRARNTPRPRHRYYYAPCTIDNRTQGVRLYSLADVCERALYLPDTRISETVITS